MLVLLVLSARMQIISLALYAPLSSVNVGTSILEDSCSEFCNWAILRPTVKDYPIFFWRREFSLRQSILEIVRIFLH